MRRDREKVKREDQATLERELHRLTAILKLPDDYHVVWQPRESSPIDGEVKGGCILIYVRELESAKATLKHEVLDLAITRAVEAPYKSLVLTLIKQLDEQVYRRKEDLVNALVEVI